MTEKRKAYMKKYREANKEKLKEYRKQFDDYYKQYKLDNKEKLKDSRKKYYDNNREEILLKKKEYTNKSKESKKKYNKEYYENNTEKIKKDVTKYVLSKLKTDSLFKLKENTRRMIGKSLKRNGYTKQSRTYEILGCTFDEFKTYIEAQFEDWMDWGNYGLYEKGKFNIGWDIDHIIPTSSAKTEEEIIKLNHYTNLQPLCSKINRDIKRDTILCP